ncbi:MAG: 16S rRNA (guanine(527)-N(7))-methyltransferase RsmG [Syntrophales bacterium]|jgi:16S rRNA (guanine527-N7)-methyltransferase|nr:16S rRNA (guanine(527)-N(7))-methyltransferase RsmG [Syntrophales bacterium]
MEQALIQMLADEAAAMGVSLGPRELDQFSLFYDEFQLWNTKINLSAVTAGPIFIVKHFLDSLLPLPLIPPSARTLLDMGTGGGFPGIPLAIADWRLRVTLLEASRKKTSFLNHTVQKLGLHHVLVNKCRVGDSLGNSIGSGQYDVVISRATFKLSRFLMLANLYCGYEGVIIAMKGRSWQKEMDEAGKMILSNRLQLMLIREMVLPRSDEIRTLLLFKKT